MTLGHELYGNGNHKVIVTNVAASIRSSCRCVPMNLMKVIWGRNRARRPSGYGPARSRCCGVLKIENPTFSRDPRIAHATKCAPLWDLMAPSRRRAKKKGTQRERQVPDFLSCGTRYAQRCPVEFGLAMEVVIAA